MFAIKIMFKNFASLLFDLLRRGSNKIHAPSAEDEYIELSLLDTSLTGLFNEETDELLEGFKISPEDVVLDVGCGDSPFLLFCARRGIDVIFSDIDSDKMVKIAKKLKGSPARSITALVSDACCLPLKDASVTKILATEIMEHVDDPALLLKELFRVGKPGAQYLITVPDPVSEELQKDIAPPIYFEKPNHVRIVSRNDFGKWVADAGFLLEARKHYGFYWTLWWMFFWACNQDLSPPWHPALVGWAKTWNLLLRTEQGPKIKRILDDYMPKTQAIIAKKPEDN